MSAVWSAEIEGALLTVMRRVVLRGIGMKAAWSVMIAA